MVLTTFKSLYNKIKYIFNHNSATEIYELYIEGEFLRVIDEDFFTLLRIPEAIDTGDSLNHYDHNSVNHWISTHPKFIIPFLVTSATVGIARVIQILSSTPEYPENIAEFLALVRKDQDVVQDIPELPLENDRDILNGLCNELGIPYYYKIGTVKKCISKIKTDKRSFLAKFFIKPKSNDPSVDYEELVETHEELVLCKKDEPQSTTIEESQNNPKYNWFEKIWARIENSKFVEFVIKPPWQAANRAAYAYWILWFGTVIVSAIMTGGLVLTTTGTAAVTTTALSIVIGIPSVIFLSFWAIGLINKIWPTKKLTKNNESIDIQKPNVVINRSTKESVFSLICKSLALRIHTNRQKNNLSDNHNLLLQKIQNTKIMNDEECNEFIAKSDSPNIFNLQIQFPQNQIINKEDVSPSQQKNTRSSTSKGRTIWQTFFNFCTGYVCSAFVVWFLTSAVTAFAIKFGAMAVAGALSATVVGIPLSLFITFGLSMTVGSIFAISNANASSISQKEKEAFLEKHSELRPENIAQQEKTLKSLKQRLKMAHHQHKALVAKYNEVNQRVSGNTIDALSLAHDKNLEEPLPILSKLHYRTLKNNNIAYTNTHQSTFNKISDYVLTAIGNAGRMGYITRSLMIGGMITILAVSFANPLGFLTGPIAIAIAVSVSAVLFGAATLIDRYFEQRRAKDELDNLRLRLFEVKEKQSLSIKLETQCHLIESHNKKLTEKITEKQSILDAQEKDLAVQNRTLENGNSIGIVDRFKNCFFNSVYFEKNDNNADFTQINICKTALNQ